MYAMIIDYILITVTGNSVGIIWKADLSYKNIVKYEHVKKVVYAKLNKALYVCVMPVLLWYELFDTTLDMGFKINKYDTCVANKILNGKQCNIT